MATTAAVQTEVFQLKGGLDLVSPALAITPGALIDCVNFEPAISGGYTRMAGYERLDGHPSPSIADYWILHGAITGAILPGDKVTGLTSGKTAVVLLVVGTTELVVAKLSGALFPGESLQVAGATRATFASSYLNGAETPAQHANYKSLAANNARADIDAVPGTGPVRGVWGFGGNVYAFRDSGSACLMYKATAAGWAQQTFGKELQYERWAAEVTITVAEPGVVVWAAHGFANDAKIIFSTTGVLPTGLLPGVAYYARNVAAGTFELAATAGGTSIATTGIQSGTHTAALSGTAIVAGDIVVGATSGATGTVTRTLLRTGSWSDAPIGTLVFDTVTGAFASGEALKIGGVPRAKSTSASTDIALLAGGKFEFVNTNFSGQAATKRMFFCDGVNLASEWDGVRLIPIRTGATPDAPKFIASWKGMLLMAIGGSVQFSGVSAPYSYTALTGAAEITLGDDCTGMVPQAGNSSYGSVALFTKSVTYILYGNSTADLKLVLHSQGAGAAPWTVQNLGQAYFFDTKGIVSLTTTQNYGDFVSGTLSRPVQPMVDAKGGLAVASCVVRASNQYRLFFSDGSGLILYMNGDTFGGITYFDYGPTQHMNVVASFVDDLGAERILAGGSDGYVYELSKGTSFDGQSILACLFLAFNHSKSPRIRKRYRRVVVQASCTNTADVRVGYELDYGGAGTAPGQRMSRTLIGRGGYWDEVTWDAFNWDAPQITDYTVDTPGNGLNLGLLIYGDSAVNDRFTISSCIQHYLFGRNER